nr:class I SAM-dependent methyltransferase [uncultured Methanospirillum sp.]
METKEIKEAITKSWDNSSGMYDSCPGHQIGTKAEEEAWMNELRHGIPKPPLKILDVGCGTGAMGLLYAKMGYDVYGVDLSEAMMNQAQMKASRDKLTIDLRKGDAENLPFPDESFDLIVNRHLIWTLPHPEIALDEWNRVLKKGGTLHIIDGVWNDKRLYTQFKRHLSEFLTSVFESNNSHRRGYDKNLRKALPHDGGVSQEAMRKYLDKTGFTDVTFRDLMYIRALQRERMPWYRKITAGKSYYIIHAKK